MTRTYTDPNGKTIKVPKITKHVIRANAGNAAALYNLGTYELQAKNYANATRLFRLALELKETPEALLNLSTCYKMTNDSASAYKILGRCMDRYPNFALAYNNSGLIDYDYRRLDLAIEKYEKALALDPNYADAHWNFALALYLKFFSVANNGAYDKSEYDNALAHFNWRFRKSNPVRIAFHHGTVWEGQDLGDQQLMILSEQGLGDIIQFSRYAYQFPPGKVVLHIPKETHCMIREGYECTISSIDPTTKYYMPLMSMSQYFPFDGSPYIFWNERRELAGDLKIGICWKGNREHANDRNRSRHFKDFYWLFKYGTVYSFQYGVSNINALAKDIHYLDIGDWKDTMTYVNSVDIVVTVDTSLAHLCGAMGKPCIVLMPKIGIDWRWGEVGTRTVWYDSLRLAREQSMDAAEKLLKEFISGSWN
jgi:tetratricopeptide (TPR) repeat protein